jgi:DNA-binding transcriptional MerR regulator
MEEACRILQLPHHTLRYWEARIPSLRPVRLPSGHRRYTRENLETILRVKDLMHDGKMTLAGVRRALAGQRSEPAKPAVPGTPLKVLQDLRSDLRDILAELNK